MESVTLMMLRSPRGDARYGVWPSCRSIHNDSGALIDPRFQVQWRQLVPHSRGGKIVSPNAPNTQYVSALHLLLERIERSELTQAGVWVDSSVARQLPIGQRLVFSHHDTEICPKELFRRLSRRMASVGRDSNERHARANSINRLRFAFAERPSDERIVRVVGCR